MGKKQQTDNKGDRQNKQREGHAKKITTKQLFYQQQRHLRPKAKRNILNFNKSFLYKVYC